MAKKANQFSNEDGAKHKAKAKSTFKVEKRECMFLGDGDMNSFVVYTSAIPLSSKRKMHKSRQFEYDSGILELYMYIGWTFSEDQIERLKKIIYAYGARIAKSSRAQIDLWQDEPVTIVDEKQHRDQ